MIHAKTVTTPDPRRNTELAATICALMKGNVGSAEGVPSPHPSRINEIDDQPDRGSGAVGDRDKMPFLIDAPKAASRDEQKVMRVDWHPAFPPISNQDQDQDQDGKGNGPWHRSLPAIAVPLVILHARDGSRMAFPPKAWDACSANSG